MPLRGCYRPFCKFTNHLSPINLQNTVKKNAFYWKTSKLAVFADFFLSENPEKFEDIQIFIKYDTATEYPNLN